MNESRPITHLPSPRPRVPGWARAALYLVAWFLLYAALASVGGVLAWGIGAAIPLAPTDPAGLAQAWITLAIICWLVLLGTVWLTAVFWRNLDRRPAQEFGFHPPQLWLRDTMAGLVLGAAAIFTVVLLGALAGWYRVRSPANAAEAARVLGAALLVLLPAAAVEEVAMRGYVLQT
ncbi:MAG: hypothetical protein HY320_01830, partial [Armatimonadetes bacterium]|nr:hypothetical protein [Armatimonadota bacterium]